MTRTAITPAQVDRAGATLLGQACGDALGVPYEFAAPPTGDAHMLGGGLGPYAPGEWSDDTQMAVCIARVAATGAELTGEDALDAIAAAFEEWVLGGASDVGTQTRAVLGTATRLPGGRAAALRSASRTVHDRTGRSAGNGALMRTSAAALTRLADRDHTAAAVRAVAELTHHDPLAGDSAVLWSEAIRAAVTTGTLTLLDGLDLLPTARRDQWAAWVTAAAGAEPARFAPNGFTVTALQAAWAAITSTAHHENHLEQGLHAAVRAGDDTDTVAAIAGGLLGARYGQQVIPSAWRNLVHGWPALTGAELATLGERTATAGTG